MSESPISVSGQMPEKTAGRIGEALADLFSPITETTGLIGDSIRHHRERMAKKRISGVHEKASILNLEVTKAPYKFISNWADGATIENEDSPINDLWENLLLSGITNYKTYLNSFINILRQFGGSEVLFLQALAGKHGPLDGGAQLIPQTSSEDEFPRYFRNEVQSSEEPGIIWNNVVLKHDSSGSLGYHILGGTFTFTEGKSFFYHDLYHNNYVALELLVRERLVKVNKARINSEPSIQITIPGRTFELVWATLTQFGIEFTRACLKPELRRS